MAITVRPANSDDLDAADALVVESINDLTVRHGFGAIAKPSSPRFQRFCLRDDPDGLWIAEQAREMVGFALSWENDGFWFLAQLFVRPGLQGAGVGQKLFAQAMLHADQTHAKSKALITFAFNRASQGLYMRQGFYPVAPLYMMSASRDALVGTILGGHLRAEPLAGAASSIDRLAEIDATAVGAVRVKHHRYMLGEGGLYGVSLWAADACVGYAYIGQDGHIGPVAVRSADNIADALAAAIRVAADLQSGSVSAFVPGSIPAAIDCATRSGMRITLPMLLMGDAQLQPWKSYMPRNPGLM